MLVKNFRRLKWGPMIRMLLVNVQQVFTASSAVVIQVLPMKIFFCGQCFLMHFFSNTNSVLLFRSQQEN